MWMVMLSNPKNYVKIPEGMFWSTQGYENGACVGTALVYYTFHKSSRLCSRKTHRKSLSIHPIQQLFLDANLYKKR